MFAVMFRGAVRLSPSGQESHCCLWYLNKDTLTAYHAHLTAHGTAVSRPRTHGQPNDRFLAPVLAVETQPELP